VPVSIALVAAIAPCFEREGAAGPRSRPEAGPNQLPGFRSRNFDTSGATSGCDGLP
jgi:hypothetical protein